jgi:hypothetical protein
MEKPKVFTSIAECFWINENTKKFSDVFFDIVGKLINVKDELMWYTMEESRQKGVFANQSDCQVVRRTMKKS